MRRSLLGIDLPTGAENEVPIEMSWQPPPGLATMLFETLSMSPPGALIKTDDPVVL